MLSITERFSDSPQNRVKLWVPVLCILMCSVSLKEVLRKTETHTEPRLISGCAYKLREVKDRWTDNQGDGGRRWGGGAAGASVGPSIVYCCIFCLLLKQGPYTYIWWNWHSASFKVVNSVMTQGKSAGTQTGFVGLAKTFGVDVDDVILRRSIKWQVGRSWHSKTKWWLPFMICGNDCDITG